MDKNYYNINFVQYGILMLPPNMRKGLIISFVKAVMSPMDDLNNQFTALRKGIDYKSYSQVCYMQGLLNDNFDPLERRIKIKNSHVDQDSYLLWKGSKEKPTRFFKEGVEGFKPFGWDVDGLLGVRNLDFEVVLPKGFRLSEEEENKMINLVNQSKLASKLYTITNG